jgi:LysR family transcriptional activator of nhaA
MVRLVQEVQRSINYHHLHYFWMVAAAGSVSRAARLLGLSQPAISAQIRALERALGDKLFLRKGRGIALSDFGHLVQHYANQIFRTGQELSHAIAEGPGLRPLSLRVGVNHGMPKLVVHHILEPALQLSQPVRMLVRDDRPERLLADLIVDEVDLVLSDAPAPAGVRVFSHSLGQCGVTVFGAPELLAEHKGRFPQNLGGAPFLLPGEETTLRRSLDGWFMRHQIRPKVVAELADTTVLREFGRSGAGFFAALTAVRDEVSRLHNVRPIGALDGIVERFYGISTQRRLKHPAIVAIIKHARRDLFA